MRAFPFFLAALALFAFSLPAQAQEDAPECSLKVVFGAYQAGIDVDSYEDVREILDDSDEVDTYTDVSWGRAGERTICVKTYSMAATDRLYNEVIKYVPKVSDKFWVEVVHEDGRTRKTHWPS